MSGRFIISLDFELLWGVRDHSDREGYGKNILGAREAIPRMLDLFAENEIHATWATVGFAMCADRDELMASLPSPDEQPRYRNPRLSNYSYLDEVGPDESRDPFYFGASLVERIAQTPGQEIGTHTLSHYYCLEDGHQTRTFEADLRAACSLAKTRNIEIKSIVFPRNQYAPEHLEICRRHGVTSFRGNPTNWAYRPAKGSEQTQIRRALRLADAYTGLLGAHAARAESGTCTNLPASRFLRPASGRLALFHPLHIGNIKRGMTVAAKTGADYHLWWHPHNFGRDLETNLAGLGRLFGHLTKIGEKYGMHSRTMADCV
ncbi:polysaccharide deacetylase family protein [Thioclava sp.]|uniref:polysaccharide deacetylase family protein n=1 Tax=Thioclava sp. TaxID=1933450 RepID=UPI003AA97489